MIAWHRYSLASNLNEIHFDRLLFSCKCIPRNYRSLNRRYWCMHTAMRHEVAPEWIYEMRLRLFKHQHDSSLVKSISTLEMAQSRIKRCIPLRATISSTSRWVWCVCQTKFHFSVEICAATTSIGCWFVINWNFCLALISERVNMMISIDWKSISLATNSLLNILLFTASDCVKWCTRVFRCCRRAGTG